MAYTIILTDADMRTVAFVGDRYCWSSWMIDGLREGTNELTEADAWEFADAIDDDMAGGHPVFPMLDGSSDLFAKLQTFRESIV